MRPTYWRLRQWLRRKGVVGEGRGSRGLFPYLHDTLGLIDLASYRKAQLSSCAKGCILVREPDAGNPPVRFDERGVETGHGRAREAPATERAGNGLAIPKPKLGGTF